MPAPDPLHLYLALLSAAAFAIAALDRRLRDRRGADGGISHAALIVLAFAGGAAGSVLGFLAFDRHTSKRNSAWHALSLVALLAWGLVLVARHVAPLDAGAVTSALGRDHTPLLVYLAAANAVTFLAFVADKLVAVWNGRGHGAARVPEMALLLLSLAGGSPGGLLAMLVARHKIRTPAFAVGLPLMLVVQLAAVAYLLQLGLA